MYSSNIVYNDIHKSSTCWILCMYACMHARVHDHYSHMWLHSKGGGPSTYPDAYMYTQSTAYACMVCTTIKHTYTHTHTERTDGMGCICMVLPRLDDTSKGVCVPVVSSACTILLSSICCTTFMSPLRTASMKTSAPHTLEYYFGRMGHTKHHAKLYIWTANITCFDLAWSAGAHLWYCILRGTYRKGAQARGRQGRAKALICCCSSGSICAHNIGSDAAKSQKRRLCQPSRKW